MTAWEKKIVEAFIERYFSSSTEIRQTLRFRSSKLFPDFETAPPGEKDSYLEAAESLERKGVVKLKWEKRGKGEKLISISCENFEGLFTQTGKPNPKTEVENIKTIINYKIQDMKNAQMPANIIMPLESMSVNFSTHEIWLGLDQKAIEDLLHFLEYFCKNQNIKNITIRALSILLYKDSKRLEQLLSLASPLLSRLNLQNTIPERSYPEALISGKLVFEFNNSATPMVNTKGLIINLPLETTEAIINIKPLSNESNKTVLTIENKETFFALGSPFNNNKTCYDCYLNISGYPNRAATSLIKTLASSGFSFYHAGDLDPDGILILQHIGDIANRSVTPVKMDAATFDQYRPWARSLTKPMLRQISKISEKTRAIPGTTGLIQRIEETGLGVEQEIVDYR